MRLSALFPFLIAAALSLSAGQASAQIEVGKPFPFPEMGLPLAESGDMVTLDAFAGEALLLHIYASW